MPSNTPHHISHALTPEQQAEYLTWARALRLSTFGPWEPSEAIPGAQSPPHPTIPETNFVETSTVQPKRKPAFRKVLQGKVTRFCERVLEPVRHRFQRSGLDSDPDQQALLELQKEIKREEKRLRGGEKKGGDKERRKRELKTAGQVVRAVREELKRRDTGGLSTRQVWL